jgi:hypothetical protein
MVCSLGSIHFLLLILHPLRLLPQEVMVGVNRISHVPHIDDVDHNGPLSILTQSLTFIDEVFITLGGHIGW